MKKMLVLMALLVGLVLTVQPALADPDPLKLWCVSPSVCTSGSVSLIGGGTFDVIRTDGNYTGELFLGVLVPNGPATLTVSLGSLEETKDFTASAPAPPNNNLGTLLGETGMKDYQFATMASASAQVGVTATSFKVYEYDLGNFTIGGASGLPPDLGPVVLGSFAGPITVSGAPTGTVIVAWLESTRFDQTAMSESLTVPEPGILILLGIAMSAIGAASWRLRKL